MSKRLIVAIDGPAGSGKSTSAKLVAEKLDYLYIDTGAMYRAITFLALQKNIIKDENAIALLAENVDIKLFYKNGTTRVFVDGKDLTEDIRSLQVNANVSAVSKIEAVRTALVKKQRALGESKKGIVMEGRDIGTVVFPNADVKIFLTASLDKRALRRLKEFKDKGIEVPEEKVKNNLLDRDRTDSSREVSPLIKAPDAIEVDTSSVTIDEQVAIILNKVKETALEKGIEIL